MNIRDIANDSYEEIDAENKNLQHELNGKAQSNDFDYKNVILEIHQRWQKEKDDWADAKTGLEQRLNQEIILKKQSVNKLVQVMTSKKQPMNDEKGGQSRKMLKVGENRQI